MSYARLFSKKNDTTILPAGNDRIIEPTVNAAGAGFFAKPHDLSGHESLVAALNLSDKHMKTAAKLKTFNSEGAGQLLDDWQQIRMRILAIPMEIAKEQSVVTEQPTSLLAPNLVS